MGSIDKFYSIFEKDKLNNALESAFKKKADITWIALLMSILSTSLVFYKNCVEIKTLNPAKGEMPIFLLVGTFIVGCLLIISSVWFCMSIKKWLKNRQYSLDNLKNDIFSSEVKHEHNYVFIIKKNIDKTPKLLFLKRSQWGFLLPYCRPKHTLTINEIVKEASNCFNGIRVTVNLLEHLALNDVIKKKPEEGYRKFSYIFCHVIVHSSFLSFKQLIDSSPLLPKYSFKSLIELKDDLLTMKSNSDIVNFLTEENVFESEESFVDSSSKTLPADLKVIWNITDQCSFDCLFCATKRNTGQRDELTFEKRIYIAEELRKIEGVKVDFAGGDPLYDSEAKNAIKHISKYMINDNITITSTGVGLSNVDSEELFKLCNQFDISYDYPSTWTNDHRGKTYNERNFEQIKRMLNSVFTINILVTLSNHNTAVGTIKAMITELKTIKPNRITLLRLMPVGKQRYQDYPTVDVYDPSEAIKMFKEAFGDKVKLHCAFRAYMENSEECPCNLLRKKIGIDNLGNVYACAWAGYLPIKNEDNPFFLGNILSGGIEKIFKSKIYENLHDMIESSNGKFCKIFSYSENKTNGLVKNHDKFIEKYVLQ